MLFNDFQFLISKSESGVILPERRAEEGGGRVSQNKQLLLHKSGHIFKMKPITAVTHVINILL